MEEVSHKKVSDLLAREMRELKREQERRLIESCITGIHRNHYFKDDNTFNISLIAKELNLDRKKVMKILNKDTK